MNIEEIDRLEIRTSNFEFSERVCTKQLPCISCQISGGDPCGKTYAFDCKVEESYIVRMRNGESIEVPMVEFAAISEQLFMEATKEPIPYGKFCAMNGRGEHYFIRIIDDPVRKGS